MAARAFRFILLNDSGFNLTKTFDHLCGGEWTPGLTPPNSIPAGKEATWRSESGGDIPIIGSIGTGTEGYVRYRIDTTGDIVYIYWTNPFLGITESRGSVSKGDVDPDCDFKRGSSTYPPETSKSFYLAKTVETRGQALGDNMLFEAPGAGTLPGLLGEIAIAPVYVFGTTGLIFDATIYLTLTRTASAPVPPGSMGSVGQSFGDAAPSRQQMAMQLFRTIAEKASASGFVGGFPNFYEAYHGSDRVNGTVFVKQATAEWRDVPLAELGNVSLDDFGERMRATNAWASKHGFIGGFPTFFHADSGSGVVCGTVLIKSDGAEWRDIPLSELGNPALDDFEARFRATQDYASRNGFVGGFPTFYHAQNKVFQNEMKNIQNQAKTRPDPAPLLPDRSMKNIQNQVKTKVFQNEVKNIEVKNIQKNATVCGTILLKTTFAEWRDVLFQLPVPK